MSNGDKPVERCHLCGHGGPVQFSETCICDCHKPQPAVTEGPYVGGFDSITGPAFGMTSQSQKLAGYFEKPDHAAKVANHVHNYAFAQGASSKQAEVDKLKAENEGLRGAINYALRHNLCACKEYYGIGEGHPDDCPTTILQKSLSAHRDGEGVGG